MKNVDVVLGVDPLIQWIWCGPYSDYWVGAGCPRVGVTSLETVALNSRAVVLACRSGEEEMRMYRETVPVAALMAAATADEAAGVVLGVMARLVVRAMPTPRHLALERVRPGR